MLWNTNKARVFGKLLISTMMSKKGPKWPQSWVFQTIWNILFLVLILSLNDLKRKLKYYQSFLF